MKPLLRPIRRARVFVLKSCVGLVCDTLLVLGPVVLSWLALYTYQQIGNRFYLADIFSFSSYLLAPLVTYLIFAKVIHLVRLHRRPAALRLALQSLALFLLALYAFKAYLRYQLSL